MVRDKQLSEEDFREVCIDDTLASEEYKKYVKANVTGAAKNEHRIDLATNSVCRRL